MPSHGTQRTGGSYGALSSLILRRDPAPCSGPPIPSSPGRQRFPAVVLEGAPRDHPFVQVNVTPSGWATPSWASSPLGSGSQTRGKMTPQTARVARQDAELLFFAFFLPRSLLAMPVTPAAPRLPGWIQNGPPVLLPPLLPGT